MNDVRYGPEAAIATARAAGVPLTTMSMPTNRQTLFRLRIAGFGIPWYNLELTGWLFRPAFGELSHEIVFRLRRAVSRRYFVSRLAMQRKRSGNVATHNRLLASRRLGRSTEADGKTNDCVTAQVNDIDSPPDIRLVNRANVSLRAEYSIGAACQAGEIRQHLQRRLRNKLQGRQRALGWM
ncbi:hypothetical protein FXB40_04535 [Bradyrhizobium rifense]|uniref:Uncharacterized protein n=1 Tax=Bradyrhizobium rifense TaxID=515499 RepID=A0A5D3KNA8_9BRAD|nr:hypothetical protein [Bradyrhizobium rifense]TYL98802.1 hypothetical protein FXB40_04535 [Bradyrhizobium rifense]